MAKALLVCVLCAFAAEADAASPAGMTLDFTWGKVDRCTISSSPNPAFVLSGVPSEAKFLSFSLSHDPGFEVGGGDLPYTGQKVVAAGSFYSPAPCVAGDYRWTVTAEDALRKPLASASKTKPLP